MDGGCLRRDEAIAVAMLQADALEIAESSDEFVHVTDLLRSESTWRANAFRHNYFSGLTYRCCFYPAPVDRAHDERHNSSAFYAGDWSICITSTARQDPS